MHRGRHWCNAPIGCGSTERLAWAPDRCWIVSFVYLLVVRCSHPVQAPSRIRKAGYVRSQDVVRSGTGSRTLSSPVTALRCEMRVRLRAWTRSPTAGFGTSRPHRGNPDIACAAGYGGAALAGLPPTLAPAAGRWPPRKLSSTLKASRRGRAAVLPLGIAPTRGTGTPAANGQAGTGATWEGWRPLTPSRERAGPGSARDPRARSSSQGAGFVAPRFRAPPCHLAG